MFDKEFNEYLETTGVTDPATIHHMQETWDHVYSSIHKQLTDEQYSNYS